MLTQPDNHNVITFYVEAGVGSQKPRIDIPTQVQVLFNLGPG